MSPYILKTLSTNKKVILDLHTYLIASQVCMKLISSSVLCNWLFDIFVFYRVCITLHWRCQMYMEFSSSRLSMRDSGTLACRSQSRWWSISKYCSASKHLNLLWWQRWFHQGKLSPSQEAKYCAYAQENFFIYIKRLGVINDHTNDTGNGYVIQDMNINYGGMWELMLTMQ